MGTLDDRDFNLRNAVFDDMSLCAGRVCRRAIASIIATVDLRRIQQLSPSLVNRIGGGRGHRRPAAVVKELVENAIDAAAAEITVEAEDGAGP